MIAIGQPFVNKTDLQRELSPELFEYCVQHMAPYPDGGEGESCVLFLCATCSDRIFNATDALDYQSFASALYGESEL